MNLRTAAFLGFFLGTSSRGVLEMMFNKLLAYSLQAVCLFGMVLLLVFHRPVRGPRAFHMVRPRGELAIIWASFGAIGAFSAWLTVARNYDAKPLAYLLIMLAISAMLVFIGSTSSGGSEGLDFRLCVAVVGLLLTVFGILQTLRISPWALPGSDPFSMGFLVRPASLTGSYLHYPLILSLLFFCEIHWYAESRKIRHILLALLFILSVFVSLSRSGMLIIGIGLAAYVIYCIPGITRLRYFVVGSITVGSLFALFGDSIVFQRVVSSVDLSDAGNIVRMARWTEGFSVFSSGPFFVGSHTGQYTNITSNIYGTARSVVESGLLQQLIAFGVLGASMFYWLLVAPAIRFARSAPWLFCGYMAGVIESIIYQSIEVLPYLASLVLLVGIANATLYRAESIDHTAGQDSWQSRDFNRRGLSLGMISRNVR